MSSFWCVLHSFETDKHCRAHQLLKQGAINQEPFTRSNGGQSVDQDTEQELIQMQPTFYIERSLGDIWRHFEADISADLKRKIEHGRTKMEKLSCKVFALVTVGSDGVEHV